MAGVHATAVVHPDARIDATATIGPFSTVGPEVTLAAGVVLHSHVAVAGHTTVGARTAIFPFASIGHQPQDLKYRGESSTLVIGADCILREGVTINPGTAGGGLQTVVGDRCAFLANAHVGHDCRVGSDVILSNNVMLAGHVTVEDHAIFGGGAAAIQFSRIGTYAFVGGLSGVENDVIPYGSVIGNRARLGGLNVVGLRRAKVTREEIAALRQAVRDLFAAEGTLAARVDGIAARHAGSALVERLVAFVRAGGDRALTPPRARDWDV